MVSSGEFYDRPYWELVLWLGMVTNADDFGLVRAQVEHLRTRFLSRGCSIRVPSVSDLCSVLERWGRHGMLTEHSRGDVSYYRIENFDRYQSSSRSRYRQTDRQTDTHTDRGVDGGVCVPPAPEEPEEKGRLDAAWQHLEHLAKDQPSVHNPRAFALSLREKYDHPGGAGLSWWREPDEAPPEDLDRKKAAEVCRKMDGWGKEERASMGDVGALLAGSPWGKKHLERRNGDE